MTIFAIFSGLLAGVATAREPVIYSCWVVRHGDRTPVSKSPFPRLDAAWPSYGELTPEGMLQARALGTWYRGRYVDQMQLLTPHYVAGEISVLSTARDRTLDTAACLLLGLYPPGTGPRLTDGRPALSDGLQPVPVYSIPNGDKNILIRESEMPEVNRLMIAATLRGLRPDPSMRRDLVRWGTLLGAPITTAERLMLAADFLNCMLAHHVALPATLPAAEAVRIRDAGLALQARIYASPEMTRFYARGFLGQLRADFEARKTGSQATRVNLYAAHDTTVLALMAALRVPLASNPPYAAHLEFDLLRMDDGALMVEVSYNGQPLSLGGSHRMTLDAFDHLIDPVVRPVSATDDDYDGWLSNGLTPP